MDKTNVTNDNDQIPVIKISSIQAHLKPIKNNVVARSGSLPAQQPNEEQEVVVEPAEAIE
jgi:hypothetical protein